MNGIYVVGKIHTDKWTATLTEKGWTVAGDTPLAPLAQSFLNRRFSYSDSPSQGQPGVRPLRLAAKFYKARMELLTDIDPQDDPTARY